MRIVDKVLAFFLFLTLVGCDHASKIAAKTTFQDGSPMSLVRGVLDLTYAENRGIAFSLLTWVPEHVSRPMLVVTNLAIVVVLYLLGRRAGWTSPLDRFAFVMVAAGAVGNALDRAVRGYVIDFVHLHHWPVFNVADVLIVIGYAVFFMTHWRRSGKSSEPLSEG